MEKSFSERVTEAKGAVQSVSPNEANSLRATTDVAFVDPRPAAAIASTTGLIHGAWNVSLQDIAQSQLPAALSDRSALVITASQAGPMGAIAAHELSKIGFTNVRYLEGGTQGWLDAGYPTTR